ncbi:hypothetical protein GCM10010837_49980 [Aminobacter niigataensis]
MRPWVVLSALLVAARVCSAVIADALVLILDMGITPLGNAKYRDIPGWPVWRSGIMPMIETITRHAG